MQLASPCAELFQPSDPLGLPRPSANLDIFDERVNIFDEKFDQVSRHDFSWRDGSSSFGVGGSIETKRPIKIVVLLGYGLSILSP